MILKMMALGVLFNGKSSYLRSPWNIMDMTIIAFSILSLTPLSDSFRTFKIFRILRLLRLITRNEEMKVALKALMRAIPNILNITVIMILFFLIFGVIGVSYFKGQLHTCLGSHMDGVENKWDCLNSGGDWDNTVFNFDNTPNALVTLFAMATTVGWADIMLACAMTAGVDNVAVSRELASAFWIVYFIIFMIVGSFFFLNLFVGVVISTFNTEHDKIGGNDLLTDK